MSDTIVEHFKHSANVLQVIWFCIFQYCFIRPFFTLVAVVAQAHGRYCLSSMDPRYAYIYVAGFDAVSVTIAMYCLIQFYVQMKEELAPNRPFLKITSIKLVIFFCFWQSWLISLVAAKDGPWKPSEKMQGPDIRVGVPSLLVCVEMSAFSILHIYAFPWKPYDLKRKEKPFYYTDPTENYAYGTTRALINALNPWDIVKAFGRGMRWVFVGVRRRKSDKSYLPKLSDDTTSESTRDGRKRADSSDESATELPVMASKGGSADSDTANLLNHAQANPYGHQDSSQTQLQLYNDQHELDDHRDLPALNGLDDKYRESAAPSIRNEYGLRPSGDTLRQVETTNTAYSVASYYSEEPRYQVRDQSSNNEWDMFGGATRPDAANRRFVTKQDDF